MKNIFQVLLICMLASGACTVSGQDQSIPGRTPALKKLKIVTLPFLSFAPFFIAQEEGYFAEEGLDVEFIQMRQSTEAVPALAQGELDVLSGFINIGLLNAMVRGADMRLVADKSYITTEGCAANNFMTSQDKAAKQILSEPGLRKNLRISANLASVEGYFIDMLVAPYGITLDDLQVTYIANPAAELDALRTNSVDVALVSEPWVSRIAQAGAGRIWFRVGEVAPDFQSGVVVFGPTLLSQDREAGHRFMVAYLKGVRQFAAGKTERNLDIIVKNTRLNRPLLRSLCWPSFRIDGYINTESIGDFANWAVENAQLDRAPTAGEFWDDSFVELANKTIGTKP